MLCDFSNPATLGSLTRLEGWVEWAGPFLVLSELRD